MIQKATFKGFSNYSRSVRFYQYDEHGNYVHVDFYIEAYDVYATVRINDYHIILPSFYTVKEAKQSVMDLTRHCLEWKDNGRIEFNISAGRMGFLGWALDYVDFQPYGAYIRFQ